MSRLLYLYLAACAVYLVVQGCILQGNAQRYIMGASAGNNEGDTSDSVSAPLAQRSQPPMTDSGNQQAQDGTKGRLGFPERAMPEESQITAVLVPEPAPLLVRYVYAIDAHPLVLPEELAQMILCESSGNPSARNGSSLGLLQINAAENAQGLRLRAMGLRPEDLFDPVINVRVAMAIYAEQGTAPWGCSP